MIIQQKHDLLKFIKTELSVFAIKLFKYNLYII